MLSNETPVDKMFRSTIRPNEKLLVSEWADKYRYLSRKSSPEYGIWRTSRTPYLRRPMEVLSEHSHYQEVIVMKGSQVGFSECGFNWIGYIIDHAPGPVMMVMPTESTAKRNVKMRIEPMIDESPSLREKIGEKKYRDKENTTMLKNFPGGVLIVTGGNSAIALRSVPIKYLFIDEEDAMVANLDGEGSPIDLAKARTRTFGSRKKIFRVSTPVYEDTSTINHAYKTSSKERYYVPCPHCNGFQTIDWERIVWEDEDPETVHLECIHCKKLIKEHFKTTMLNAGEWIAEDPENKVVGFHISSLYSPLGWYSWKEAATDFLAAKQSDEKMRTFYNTVLGLTWKERGDAPDWQKIFRKREKYPIGIVPLQVKFLTQAVDIQKDRIELEVVGWGRGKQNWSITHEILEGDTGQEAVWKKLDKFIDKSYPVGKLNSIEMMPIKVTVIDSGFNTQIVYNFCRKYPRTKVFPIKGSSSATVAVQIPRSMDIRSRTVQAKYQRRGMRVWTVGVNIIKSEIYSHLRLEPPLKDGEDYPDRYYHFPEHDEEYFKQLTAEQLVRKHNTKNFPVYEWVKVRERNEILDLKVYNRAASIICGIDKMRDSDLETHRIVERIDKKEVKNQEKSLDNVKNVAENIPQQRRKSKKRAQKTNYWG